MVEIVCEEAVNDPNFALVLPYHSLVIHTCRLDESFELLLEVAPLLLKRLFQVVHEADVLLVNLVIDEVLGRK